MQFLVNMCWLKNNKFDRTNFTACMTNTSFSSQGNRPEKMFCRFITDLGVDSLIREL